MTKTIEEVYAAINPLPAMLAAKGKVKPCMNTSTTAQLGVAQCSSSPDVVERFTFGQSVENIAASEDNPTKRGFFVRSSGSMVEYASPLGVHHTPPDNLRASLQPATGGEAIASETEYMRKLAFKLSPTDQYRLAFFIAENVGYMLVPEPPHPDFPHTQSSAATVEAIAEKLQQHWQGGGHAYTRPWDNGTEKDCVHGLPGQAEFFRQLARIALSGVAQPSANPWRDDFENAPTEMHEYFLVRPKGIHPGRGGLFLPTIVQRIDGEFYATDNELDPIYFGQNEADDHPLKTTLEWQPLPSDWTCSISSTQSESTK